jgi:hypothetical protein
MKSNLVIFDLEQSAVSIAEEKILEFICGGAQNINQVESEPRIIRFWDRPTTSPHSIP